MIDVLQVHIKVYWLKVWHDNQQFQIILLILMYHIGSKVGKFDKLEENVGGVVIIRCGNSLPLTRNYSNCFSFMKDSKVKDSSTKKYLISSQKPVLFL